MKPKKETRGGVELIVEKDVFVLSHDPYGPSELQYIIRMNGNKKPKTLARFHRKKDALDWFTKIAFFAKDEIEGVDS